MNKSHEPDLTAGKAQQRLVNILGVQVSKDNASLIRLGKQLIEKIAQAENN